VDKRSQEKITVRAASGVVSTQVETLATKKRILMNEQSRKRISEAINHREFNRVPMIETSFWPETLKRWYNEGLPEEVHINEYFQLDRLEWFFPVFDCTFQIQPETIEENEKYIIRRNEYGAIVKEFKAKDISHPSLMLKPGILNRKDWEKRGKLLSVDESRFTRHEIVPRTHDCRQKGIFVAIETIEPLWFVIYNTMGYEHGLYMMAKEPELIREMIVSYTTFSIGMLGLCMEKGLVADALFLCSDLCSKNGLLFSPAYFRKLALPSLKQFSEFCKKHNLYFFWHSDGNVSELIPLLIEIGVDAIHPLEARAGNDVRDYKRQFGSSICLIGNINADIVASGDKSAIEREVAEKVPFAKEGGGYIYHIDHSVPPTVSLASYQFLLETVRKYGNY
jgi:uroporphyrinogen decarboxylase